MQTFTHYMHRWANSISPRNLIFKNIRPSSLIKFVHDKNHILLYLDKSTTVVVSRLLINTTYSFEITPKIQNWNTAIKRYRNNSSNSWSLVNSTWFVTITSEPAISSISRKLIFHWWSHGAQYNPTFQLLPSQLQHPNCSTQTPNTNCSTQNINWCSATRTEKAFHLY